MKKEIKAWVWNPANSLFKRKKSEKAVGHIISCRCPEKCALYAKGNCVAFDNHCPYGNRSCVVGFSRMALKFNAWINNFKEIHKEAYAANITQPKKLEYFMDLVYVPIAYWNLNERIEFVDGKGVFTSSKPIIKRVHFNAQLISKEILNFKPRALFGGRKTQTRRIITCPKEFKGEWVAGFYVYKRESDGAIINWPCMYDADEATFDGGEILPKYKVGEVVAVAQAYRDFGAYCINFRAMTDKRYAKAEYMPHQIRITGVRVERLQDISDEDCLAEGIEKVAECDDLYRVAVHHKSGKFSYLSGKTPREACAALIDRISGKGTWESNPYVFVYEFELVK